jgi:cytochrome c oxidase subunit 3
MDNSINKKIKDPTPLIPPAKFTLWLFMLASAMLFAAFVSAFVVHMPDGEAKKMWTSFDLPIYFFYSLVIAVACSVTIQLATNAAKQDELSKNKWMIVVTLVLSALFTLSQYLGWKQLVNMDLTFVNRRPEDISASYVWVITVLHFVHILAGVILLLVALFKSVKLEIHKKKITFMSITSTYWHFVGFLWFILYLFLYFAR